MWSEDVVILLYLFLISHSSRNRPPTLPRPAIPMASRRRAILWSRREQHELPATVVRLLTMRLPCMAELHRACFGAPKRRLILIASILAEGWRPNSFQIALLLSWRLFRDLGKCGHPCILQVILETARRFHLPLQQVPVLLRALLALRVPLPLGWRPLIRLGFLGLGVVSGFFVVLGLLSSRNRRGREDPKNRSRPAGIKNCPKTLVGCRNPKWQRSLSLIS